MKIKINNSYFFTIVIIVITILYNVFLKLILSNLKLYKFKLNFFTIKYAPKLKESYDFLVIPNHLNYILLLLLIINITYIIFTHVKR